jgi:hypothetical protein
MIYLVPPLSMDTVFPKAAPHLERAIKRGGHTTWTIPGLATACAVRQVYLFVDDLIDPKNACVGQFMPWHSGDVFFIMFIGGKGGLNWKEAIKDVWQFAKANRVNRIAGNGRDGWMRHVKCKKLATLIELIED